MRWYELAENPHVITELYHEVPLLQPIDLMKIVLSTEDAKMVLDANLSRFPERPSIQWIERGYNTLYIRLEFRNLQLLKITQWSTDNIVDAQVEETPDGQISLKIISPQCDIRAVARSLRIASVNAYQQRTF